MAYPTQVSPVNQALDCRDYEGTPGYALLIVAANTHLSVPTIEDFLSSKDVERGMTWIQRRRWLFQQPGTRNAKGGISDRDGMQKLAVEIMRRNTTVSLRGLTRLLKERGIDRSTEWVRKHRCD